MIKLRAIYVSVNRDAALLLDSQLCFLLHATSRAVTQTYVRLLEPLGLTYPQYLSMLVLWEQDGISVGQIGERLLLDSGTLTPLLKRLEGMGLVERRRSQTDERVVEIHLTASGRRLRARAEGVPTAMFCASGLSHSSADRLGTELRRLLAALTLSPPTPPDAPTTKPEPKKESAS
jgi:DNA-binding MarR family transcriptional regulator